MNWMDGGRESECAEPNYHYYVKPWPSRVLEEKDSQSSGRLHGKKKKKEGGKFLEAREPDQRRKMSF